MAVRHSSLCRQTKVPKKFGPFVQVGGELAKDKNLFCCLTFGLELVAWSVCFAPVAWKLKFSKISAEERFLILLQLLALKYVL